jgi:adenine phosphoribosyltransferase
MDLHGALSLVREIPDYPKPGILFQDITPMLANAQAFNLILKEMSKNCVGAEVIAGIEARGFIFGSALAAHNELSFVPIRKSGKLPYQTISEKYGLEYGSDEIEVHVDAFLLNQKVLIVDDVLATGGTLLAAIELTKRCGAEVAGVLVLMELGFLEGRKFILEKYPDLPITSLVTV